MGIEETRDLSAQSVPASGPVHRGRNIIAVIGIDAYERWRKLGNAVSDAEGIRGLFKDRLGFKELAEPLFNAQATQLAINALLLDVLGPQLDKDDSLVVFFAGHGHTETTQVGAKAVKTGYLIPVDGRLPAERRFSGYIELDTLLKNLARLPARHVLLILDACYSGFALGSTVEVLRSQERYTDDLSRRVSRRVITSAMDDQPALDNGPIPGHSLFTGTLIKAIDDGQADGEKKGFVTSSELALYLQQTVGSSSGSRQTPDFGSFQLDDRGELVISLRGETFNKAQARECLEVARSVYELGWITGDPKRFSSAIREYRRAIEFAGLAKADLPQAEFGLGTALWARGDTDEAIARLSALIERDPDSAPQEAGLYLGLAHARAGATTGAARVLRDWVGRNPQHMDADWVQAYLGWLDRSQAGESVGRRRALLIGINEYVMDGPRLNGCVNDVSRLMRPLLLRWGFAPEDIVLLTDQQATRERVLTELDELAARSRPEDAVLVHFSGHAVPSSNPQIFGSNDRENVYLILHDTHRRDGWLANGITAATLHDKLQAITSLRKTLILDTHANSWLVERAEQEGTYTMILASDTAEIAYEWSLVVDGEALDCGMLTGALYQAGTQLPGQDLTHEGWVDPAVRICHDASSDASKYRQLQTPLLAGQKGGRVLGGEDHFCAWFEFSHRRCWPKLNANQLATRYRQFRAANQVRYPRAHLAFGQALLAKGATAASVEALGTALAQLGREDTEVLVRLLHAYLATGDSARALEACRRLVAVSAGGAQATATELLSRMQSVLNSDRHAVLVGIDRHRSPRLPTLNGAVNDTRAMQKVLVERWRFRPDRVRLLCDQDATREAVLAEFRRLAELSKNETALFFFAGLGSTDSERRPTLVSHDGRTKGVADIPLEELAALAGDGSDNLYVILDAGFGGAVSHDSRLERTIPPDARRHRPAQQASEAASRPDSSRAVRIGALTLLNSPPSWR